MQTLTSKYSFDETVSRLGTAIESNGMDNYAGFDQQNCPPKQLNDADGKVIALRHAQSRHAADVHRHCHCTATAPASTDTEQKAKYAPPITDTRALITRSRSGLNGMANTLANAEIPIQNRRGIRPSPTHGGWNKSNAHHSTKSRSHGKITVLYNDCRNGQFHIPGIAGMTAVRAGCHITGNFAANLICRRHAFLFQSARNQMPSET